MASIKEFNSRFQKINFRKTVMESVRLTSFDILTLNKEEGLAKGLLATGTPVIPSYSSPLYVAVNKKKSFSPDLHLTGAFYNGFYINLGAYSFKIGSNDDKAAKLEAKYTNQIYGLNPNGIQRYAPILYEKLFASIKQQSGL